MDWQNTNNLNKSFFLTFNPLSFFPPGFFLKKKSQQGSDSTWPKLWDFGDIMNDLSVKSSQYLFPQTDFDDTFSMALSDVPSFFSFLISPLLDSVMKHVLSLCRNPLTALANAVWIGPV